MAKEKSPLHDKVHASYDTTKVSDESADVPDDINQDMLPFIFQFRTQPAFEADQVITQMLENNVAHLDALRRSLETSNNKHIEEVRLYGDSMASALLAGVEGTVDYADLVVLINSLKQGVAQRRVTLAATA